MREKIEWYQEVLSLEPGSKVFFPMAKLYVSIGEPDKALTTLKQGLDRHPDFLEARFMLVDLLVRQGRPAEAREHIGHVTEPLAEHPAFWRLWAQSLQEQNRELAVFLMLVASNLTGKEVRWTDVVMEGLNSLSERLVGMPEPDEAVVVPAPADEAGQEPEAQARPPKERESGIRTRTMADILASQGDYASALDIYRDLWNRSTSEDEKEVLAERIEQMEAGLSGGAPAQEPAAGEDVFGKHAKNRLISTLEALAARFEARVQE